MIVNFLIFFPLIISAKSNKIERINSTSPISPNSEQNSFRFTGEFTSTAAFQKFNPEEKCNSLKQFLDFEIYNSSLANGENVVNLIKYDDGYPRGGMSRRVQFIQNSTHFRVQEEGKSVMLKPRNLVLEFGQANCQCSESWQMNQKPKDSLKWRLIGIVPPFIALNKH